MKRVKKKITKEINNIYKKKRNQRITTKKQSKNDRRVSLFDD